MPGWQSRSLEECIERVKYDAKIPRSDFLKAGSYPIVSQEADFINGFWDNAADLFKTDSPVIVFGDHTQVLKYIDFDFVIGADGVKVLKTKPFLNSKYLYYFLRSIRLERLGYARHYRLLAKVCVNYPSLPEQERIAAILNEAFEGIDAAVAKAEKNLTNARELFDSYLASVFAKNGHRWTEQKLGEICEFEGGSQPPKSEFVYVQTEGHMRFLQIRDFASDKNITYIPVSKKNRVCKDTDILIGRYGASVGKILTGKSGAYNVAIIKTIPNSRVISRSWFYNYLISSLFQSNLSKVASRSAQAGFSNDDIYNFPVPVPSLPDQAILTAKIQAISSESYRLRSIYRRKVEHLTELRQTLLERAFAGDLTVGSKDPLREAAE